jgi:hypothetical protein
VLRRLWISLWCLVGSCGPLIAWGNYDIGEIHEEQAELQQKLADLRRREQAVCWGERDGPLEVGSISDPAHVDDVPMLPHVCVPQLQTQYARTETRHTENVRLVLLLLLGWPLAAWGIYRWGLWVAAVRRA